MGEECRDGDTMSFRVTPDGGETYTEVVSGLHLELKALSTIEVPPLCGAVIPHGLYLEGTMPDPSTDALMVSAPHVFESKSLLVDSCLVRDGEVTTCVFNLSKKRVKIRKGESVSVLVAL